MSGRHRSCEEQGKPRAALTLMDLVCREPPLKYEQDHRFQSSEEIGVFLGEMEQLDSPARPPDDERRR